MDDKTEISGVPLQRLADRAELLLKFAEPQFNADVMVAVKAFAHHLRQLAEIAELTSYLFEGSLTQKNFLASLDAVLDKFEALQPAPFSIDMLDSLSIRLK